jgi:ABC-type nitrate/sulfonate/bicarbonate transport system permease component
VLLLLWQFLGKPTSPHFPPPSTWFDGLAPLVTTGALWPAIVETAVTFLLGLLIATVLGALLGALVGASRRVDRALSPSLEFLRALPAAALVPVAALVLGYTTHMKLVVVVLPTTWPILLICRSARRALSPVLLDTPRTLGLSTWDRVTKVLTPALLPAVLSGVRVTAPLALIVTLLAEILTRIGGLGAALGTAQANFLSAQVYGLLVVAGVLGFVITWFVARAEEMTERAFGTKGDSAQ